MVDEIRVYKDEVLLNLTDQMALCMSEEAGFFHDQSAVNEKGRRLKDVATDMIEVYEKTNAHLRKHYPMNAVADRWIAVNEFSALSVKETWLE